MKRRRFLNRSALMGASTLVTVGTRAWTWRSTTADAAQQNLPRHKLPGQLSAQSPRLIVVLLRGAADGLNIVVPYQEADYYVRRPTIAIAQPGQPDGALDLDGQFGLHPSLAALMPQWQAGNLAFVHATGYGSATRSHFQAQDNLETGTPGITTTVDGWMNRLLPFVSGSSPAQAVNVGNTLPLIMTGSEPVASIAARGSTSRPLPIDRPPIQQAFDRLYADNSPAAIAYKEGRAARDVLRQAFSEESMAASRGAPAPGSFSAIAQRVAQLMTGDAATQVAFMELGEWDTHVAERGILKRHLAFLGEGLADLATALGPVYENTAVVVMSEFGRTAAENGNGGTDHGHGNALWLMGGGIQGGRFYGQWPGLADAALHQNRDLAVTTDFRDVLGAVLQQQFKLDRQALAQIFPGYEPKGFTIS